MKTRNALGAAYLAAYEATDKIADITLYLDITSERPQLDINDHQRTELYRMFRELRWALCQAEMVVADALAAQQPEQPAGAAAQRPGHAGDARRARGTRR